MTYRRPSLELGTFVDEDGAPIDYGRRWGTGHPRDDTYSVTAHPERFAPLLEVARALVDHIADAYDVDIADTGPLPGYLEAAEIGSAQYPVAVTRFTPRGADAAPLTFVETAYPFVAVMAGAAGLEQFPQCGCDACDEDVEEMAERMEQFVFAVTGGRFQETLSHTAVTAAWANDDVAHSQEMPRRVAERAIVSALKAAHRDKGATWAPWRATS